MASDRDADGDANSSIEGGSSSLVGPFSPKPERCGGPKGRGVTRRGLIVGGASFAAAPLAAAETSKSYLDVAYEDRTRRGLVIAWVEPGSGKERFAWTLRASTFTDPELPNGRGRFVLRRTHDGWRADIAQCTFPGGYDFALRIELTWDPEFDHKKPSDAQKAKPPSIKMTLRRTPDVRLELDKGLIDFLKLASADKGGSSGGVDEIGGQLSKPQLATLAQSLFGDTFDVSKASDVRLAFHHDHYWVLRAGEKLAASDVESAAAKLNRLRALSDEGVPLPFREAVFTVFSGSTSAKPVEAFILNPTAPSEQILDVRALFAGDGAPPAPDSTLSREQDVPGSPVPASTPPRVLYALVKHNAEQAEANPQDAWNGTIQFGSLASGERAVLGIRETRGARSFLGWRNQNDSNPIFALRTPLAALAVHRSLTAAACQFDDLDCLLWRGRAEDGKQRLISSLTPTRRKMRVETRFGWFTVAPLPPIAPRSGVTARVPPIRIGGTGPAKTRTLNHFAAQLALEDAAIPLGSERVAAIERRLADAKADASAATAAERAASLFSQLTFHEAECLFHIDKLSRRHVWKGTLAASSDPPQAEALVHIGATRTADQLPLPARLSLSAASLLVRRPADLLALKFRFQELVLEFGETKDANKAARPLPTGWWIVPDRRIAAFVPRAEPTPARSASLICQDKPLLATDPARYESRQDPRPLLVVEFPPQHISERAYLRQFDAEPKLPVAPHATDPAKPTEPTAAEAEILRTGKFENRKKTREDLSKRQKAVGDPDFNAFVDAFAKAVADENKKTANIPEDQAIYIGPAYLDLEAARVARRIAGHANAGPLDTPAKRAQALRILPEVELPAGVIANLRKDYDVHEDIGEGYPEPSPPQEKTPAPIDAGKIGDYFEAREDLRGRLDPRYAAFREFYNEKAKNAKHGGRSWPKRWWGRRNLIAQVELESDQSTATKAVLDIVAAFDADPDNAINEPFKIPSEARVSGPSRLVFRIPADDFEDGRPDAREGAPAGAFPFTVEALTNWGAFDLAVVRRAEKVFEPLAGVRNPPSKPINSWPPGSLPRRNDDEIVNGRFPPRWARQETRDEAARLLYQGITRGDSWAVRHDEQRALDKAPDCPKPLARLGSVTGAQRMAEIAASVRPPTLYETSIELPFRLMLSPAQDAAWRTPLGLPPNVQLTKAEDLAPRQSVPVPLWFAQLDEMPGSSSLRAIWSPDFRPEALLDPALGGPPHGPWAPWALPREVTSRNPFRKEETDPSPEQFRTGLDAADRHELVALTSLHGLPVRGRRKDDGTLADGSQFNPPPGFKLRYAATESLKGEPEDDYSAIYRPQPLGVSELTLTALGGSFDTDTNFVPPASAKVVPVGKWVNWAKSQNPGEALFDAFSIERWRQDTRLGRDIRVEVVYKGFLFPVGHRASLVKLTERRFMTGPGGIAAGPVAFLVQRFFLRVGTPLKTYPTLGQPNGGRRWPVERLEILTRITPDILDPTDATTADKEVRWEEATNGRILLRSDPKNKAVLPGLVFWPRVRAREGGEISFELQIDARGARTRLPLIFVDNTAANDKSTMQVLAEEYSRLKSDAADPKRAIVDPRRILHLGGGKRRYAAEKEPDGTSFETRQWVIEAEGQEDAAPTVDAQRQIKFTNNKYDFGSLLQGVDQPPFYPAIAEAEVRIAQVDRLVGRPTDGIRVIFDAEYRAFGFPKDDRLTTPGSDNPTETEAKTDVYLDFLKPVSLDPGAAGDRTGGAVRPNTPLVALSRSRGPVGNKTYLDALSKPALGPSAPQSASTGLDRPAPESFFGDATVLGIIDLKKAITFLVDGLAGAPQFQETTQYTSALLTDLTQTNDAGAAVAKIRDRLLIPMREALLTLTRQFFEAVRKDASEIFVEDDALARIERIYPDVGRSYRELRDALDKAISSTETVRDVEALLASFGVIYGAGRRFIAAIERVANDPLAPVHEALREAFNKFIGEVIGRANLLLEGVTDDLNKLQQFATELRAKLAALFVHPELRAWRRLVFALPGGHAIAAAFPNQIEPVDKKVEELLATTVSTMEPDFLTVVVTKGPDDAAQVLVTAFDEALKQAIKDANGEFKDALNKAYNDWSLAVGNAADQQAERIKGLAFEAATQLLKALLAAAQKLAARKEPSIRHIIGDLNEVVAAARNLVQPILDDSLARAVELCGKLAAIVKSTAEAINLPSPAEVDTARTKMVAAFNAAASAVAKVGINPAEVTNIRDALENDVGALVGVRDALASALQQLVRLQDDICSSTPEHLPLDAFAALREMRSTLFDAVQGFVVGTASPHFRGADLKSVLARINGASTDADAARVAVIDAAKGATSVAIALCRLVRDATALRDTGVDGPLKRVRDELAALANSKLEPLIAAIDKAKGDAIALRKEISDAIALLEAKVAETVVPPDAQKYLNELLDELLKVPGITDAIQAKIVKAARGKAEALEQEVLRRLGELLVAGAPYLEQMVLIAFQGLAPVCKFLNGAQAALVDARNTVWRTLGGTNKDTSGQTPVGDEIGNLTLEKVRELLLVPCPVPGRSGLVCPPSNNAPDDFLVAEKVQLESLDNVFSSAPPPLDKSVLDALFELFQAWSSGQGSAQILAKRLADAAAAVLSGDLKRIVDLEGARRRIEEKIKELVPAKIVLNYDLQAEMIDVSPVFLPRPGSQITLSAGAVFNLLEPTVPPRFRASCRIDPFDVNLFDVVTLMFDSAQFINESGKGSNFDIVYKDFELGPNAEFLKPLQALMNPGGSGPYVRPSRDVPGIEAGYSLDLGIIAVGNVSFANVSINAACILPFNGARATFVASIGREDRPVLLSVAPYTGGGFLALYADAQRLLGFAASFEFGGGGAFKFGPLHGQGRLTTGIFLRKLAKKVEGKDEDDCVIEGFFYAGGEANIACFAISATLVVRISHRSGGSMQGSAVFAFSFSFGFAKLRYQVGVQKNMGKGFSGSRSVAALVTRDERLVAEKKGSPAAIVSCSARAQQEDWLTYQTYFANDLDGFPQ